MNVHNFSLLKISFNMYILSIAKFDKNSIVFSQFGKKMHKEERLDSNKKIRYAIVKLEVKCFEVIFDQTWRNRLE